MMPDAGTRPMGPPIYASEVVDFNAGSGAGFGQDGLPDIVLGPPLPPESRNGSLDVLSLGAGGEIVVGFGERRIVDGPGADFVVFENPFEVDDGGIFAELGEVAVSTDAVHWRTFSCDPDPEAEAWPGCAGWRIVEAFDVEAMDPLEPGSTGGDPFDLADVGLESARYVRVRDVSGLGEAPSAGFDLDAIGAVHLE